MFPLLSHWIFLKTYKSQLATLGYFVQSRLAQWWWLWIKPEDECVLSLSVFSESADTYQRQIMSIFSIAMGISLLGVACMALYCKNKWVQSPNHPWKLEWHCFNTITSLSVFEEMLWISDMMVMFLSCLVIY